MNRRVNIQEDIKRYQDTISYASSKVDYRVGQNIYMLPSDMNLKIRSGTVNFGNEILISEGKFSLGKNEKVNSLEPATMKSHKTNSLRLTHSPNISHKKQELPGSHNNEKLLWYWFWQVVLQYGICLDEISIKCMGHPLM